MTDFTEYFRLFSLFLIQSEDNATNTAEQEHSCQSSVVSASDVEVKTEPMNGVMSVQASEKEKFLAYFGECFCSTPILP